MFLAFLAIIALVVAFCAIVVGISALTGWLFMLLWNFAMPAFWANAPHIDFLHAWAAWILVNMVIGIVVWVKQK